MSDSYTVHYSGLVIISVGLLASTLVCKVIISTVCKKQLQPVQREVIFAILFPALIYFTSAPESKQILMLVFLLASFSYASAYAYQIVNKIAELLNIKILTV